MIVTILWALVWLCIIVLVIWVILWVLDQLGFSIPANILKIIWVIVVLIAIIWLITHFFTGDIPHLRR
jgi:hypothetical protein